MIELICIWCFGKSMFETASEKGRNGWLWGLSIIPGWLCAQVIGALLTIIGWRMALGTDPNLFVVYVVALGAACIAGVLLGVFLDARPSLKPQPIPAVPLPTMRMPMPAPSSAPRSRMQSRQLPQAAPPQPSQPLAIKEEPFPFKFHCPHCEQHISTTTDEVGTQATCPACGNELTVPAPALQL